jgi:23S rRNA (adenine2503-C2)-methyltransferase
MSKKHLLDLSLEEIKELLKEWKEPPYHAEQIFSWVYQKGVLDFSKMSDLSVSLRKKLEDSFLIFGFRLKKKLVSQDATQKFLFELSDKNLIESVIIPAEGRVTGCVSSQVGCKFGCGFCASGLLGFKRNLSCAEIIEEVLYLKNNAPGLTHLVFMGTGEPLDNYDNVLKAIRIINSKDGLNIGARRITISTCGLIPGIKRLQEEGLQIELSVSLHAADDKTRFSLMPVNKKYPLARLIAACRDYFRKTGRQVTFEYVLFKGLNSSLQSAQNLSRILRGFDCKVNLIPANPVKESSLEPPNKLDILLFKDYLLKHGVNVTLRKARGEDIEAACGQLRLRYADN